MLQRRVCQSDRNESNWARHLPALPPHVGGSILRETLLLVLL